MDLGIRGKAPQAIAKGEEKRIPVLIISCTKGLKVGWSHVLENICISCLLGHYADDVKGEIGLSPLWVKLWN
jgi:hypothetical protein